MRFYQAQFPGQVPGTAVVVAEDTAASILLRWVPNTGRWHRCDELTNDYLYGNEGGAYEPLSPAQAAGLLGRVPRLDEARPIGARLLARYRSQSATDTRTNTQMGLAGLTGP